MIRTKVVEKIKTRVLCVVNFFREVYGLRDDKKGRTNTRNYWVVNAFHNLIDIRDSHGGV
jgi:hypothetical protein